MIIKKIAILLAVVIFNIQMIGAREDVKYNSPPNLHLNYIHKMQIL